MNIMENKRVMALSAVFLLAFGGLAYFGFSRGQDQAAAKAELAELNEQMEEFETAKIPPTAANAKALSDAAKQVEKANDALKGQLAKYAAFCMGNGKNITAVEFSERVRDSRDKLSNLATQNGCTMEVSAKELGMGRYINSYAQGDMVPYLTFQHDAVKRVAEILIKSGVTSVEKIFCDSLPEECIKAKKAPARFPLGFEVTFKAKRSMITDGKTPENLSPLPRVLNAITTDPDYLLIPTGIAIKSEGSLTEKAEYVNPVSVPAAIELGDDETQAEQASASRTIATRKAGSPDELIRVHLNIQVYYFPGQSK